LPNGAVSYRKRTREAFIFSINKDMPPAKRHVDIKDVLVLNK
jgi:hypothetical protein